MLKKKMVALVMTAVMAGSLGGGGKCCIRCTGRRQCNRKNQPGRY